MSNSELAAAAWNAVRRTDDAPWEKLSLLMKGKLAALAEKYAGNARVDEGDYPPEGFAEKVWQLAAAADLSVGDPIVFIESPPQMAPHGLNHVLGDRVLVGTTSEQELRESPTRSRQEFFAAGDGDGSAPELVSMGAGKVQSAAEHEDTHIPSPIPEDVDPLKDDLASAPIEIGSDSPKETPSEPTPVKKRKSAKKKTTKKAAKKSKK